jgi:two-component sensor histidine kinase
MGGRGVLPDDQQPDAGGNAVPSIPAAPSPLDVALREKAALERALAMREGELEEARALIHEVNHRAKNSLQMAMAMLSMQALASEDARTREALNGAAQRLGYLARIHELLYKRGDHVQAIEISAFLGDIVDALAGAFQRPDVQVLVLSPPLMLSTAQAINVALIAGEALLNSYKYAFPEGRAGVATVRLSAEGGTARLEISDDGVGFTAEQRRGSLGMRLLRALGRALGGETAVTGTNGTLVSVTFPLEPAHR